MSWPIRLKETITIMHASSSRLSPIRATVALIVAIAAVLIVVTVGLGSGPRPSTPTPTATPTASPTASPSPTPVGTPVATPSVPADHGPILGDVTVDLEQASHHHVKATVRDDSGHLVDVRSGTPGDGMSVTWGEIAVENVDARTLKVTWVGTGDEETVFVGISAAGDGYLVDIVQRGLGPNSDTLGYDREIVLTFDRSVSAADVSGGVAETTAP